MLGSGQTILTLRSMGLGQTLSSSTTNNFGWTAGVGVEWAFAGSWSARAEYDFIGLQNQTITVAAGRCPSLVIRSISTIATSACSPLA